MLDPVLLVALALAGGAAVAVAPAAGALAVLACALVLRARVSRLVLALALAGAMLGALRARAALTSARTTHEQAVRALTPPARCEGVARVIASPIVVGATAATAKHEAPDPATAARVDVELENALCDGHPVAGTLRARVYGADEALARGDEVDLVADLAPVHLFLNDGADGALRAIARSGVAASGSSVEATRRTSRPSLARLIDLARAHVRRRIEATYPADAAPMARALVLGEADLAAEDDEAFRVSGLAHLLAVSGTHLVIAVASLAAALRAVLVRIELIAARIDASRVSAALAIPVAWAYADFAGGSGSAVRAAAMMTAALLAQALGRRSTGARAFACALLGASLVDPLLVCDVSFALSAGATAGLLTLGKPFAERLGRGPPVLKALGQAAATTLAASVGCAPLLGLITPTLPALGVAANLVAAPLGELFALPICLAHAAVAFAPPVERALALFGSGALLAVRAVARATTATGTALPVPRPTPWQLAALAVGLAAIAVAPDRRRRVGVVAASVAALLALEIGAIHGGKPHGELRITVLDVGQGDATLVDLPDGSAMLVDGGGFVGSPVDPGTRVILPFLRTRRRTRIDVAVLTHPHPDHFTGLASALPRLAVGELWDSGQGEHDGAGPTYAALLAGLRARAVPIRRPAELCGPERRLGGAFVELLAPCPSYVPGEGANDGSLVLRLRYGRRAALLAGDAEHAAEARLLARESELRADFLKIGHHGSRTSTSEAFLRAVSPTFATISSGVRNRFGHPTAGVLSRLEARGVALGRTDRGGTVVWSTDGERVRVERPEAP